MKSKGYVMTPQEFNELMQRMEELEKERHILSKAPFQTGGLINVELELESLKIKFIPQAIQEIRKRDMAIKIALKNIGCYCESLARFGSSGKCVQCEAVKQIEEILNV